MPYELYSFLLGVLAFDCCCVSCKDNGVFLGPNGSVESSNTEKSKIIGITFDGKITK